MVSQWCEQTRGWALLFEAADQMLAVEIAAADDWDALVRRGSSSIRSLGEVPRRGLAGVKTSFSFPKWSTACPRFFALAPCRLALLAW